MFTKSKRHWQKAEVQEEAMLQWWDTYNIAIAAIIPFEVPTKASDMHHCANQVTGYAHTIALVTHGFTPDNYKGPQAD